MSQRSHGSPPVFRGAMFSDIAAPEGTEPVGGGAPPPAPSQPQSVEQRILMGPNGIRAGWRLLIFAAIVFLMFAVYGIVLKTLFHGQPGKNFSSFSPVGVMGGEAVVFLIDRKSTRLNSS